MKLIVGLGNPGEKYKDTRHNLGFTIVERFYKDFATVNKVNWQDDKKLKSFIATLDWQPKKGKSERVILAMPNTFMNNSGMAVRLLAAFYKILPEDIWVVNDELDLPVGSMKIRFGGAAAGHHGVESIIEHIGTDKFWRFRLGIGIEHAQHNTKVDTDGGERHVLAKRKIPDVPDYVLGAFGTTDKGKIRELIKHGSKALQTALEKGIEAAQNQFNTK